MEPQFDRAVRAFDAGGTAPGRGRKHVFSPVRNRIEPNHPGAPRRSGTGESLAHRLRFAFGNAHAGRNSTALSPPDPPAQTVLQRQEMHGAPAGRQHLGLKGPADRKRRPWGDWIGTIVARLRSVPPPGQRAQDSRGQISRGASRLHHRDRRGHGFSPAGRRRTPLAFPAGEFLQWAAGIGRPAGRGAGSGGRAICSWARPAPANRPSP